MPTSPDPETTSSEIHSTPEVTNTTSEALQNVARESATLEHQIPSKPGNPVEQEVLLLLDEAGSLFSKRSEVKDSHGRDSNNE
jgi:hypothetical protein